MVGGLDATVNVFGVSNFLFFLFRANFKKLGSCIRKLEMMKRYGTCKVVLTVSGREVAFEKGMVVTNDTTGIFCGECILFQYFWLLFNKLI